MIDYYKKYLKYKIKYFKLLGGGRGTYNKETNSCTWIIPKPDGQKEYFINFLWLSRDLEESRRQKYIIPFRNEMFLGINIIKLEYIIHLVNVIRWTQLNPRAVIFFWHDSTLEIVERTKTLIEELLDNEELIVSIEIVDKIIRYSGILPYNSEFKDDDDDYLTRIHQLELLEIKSIMEDILTSQYLTYTIEYESVVPSKIKKISEIKFTERFRCLISKISVLITFDETTGLIKIVPGIPAVISLDNLHFRSIIELERLKQLEYTGKHLIQYFGLNSDNSIRGKYLSSTTAGLTTESFSLYKLVIGVDLDYTKGDKIFAVDQTNSKRYFKGIVISYNKQTGELLMDLIDIADGFKNIDDVNIKYKVSKLELSVFVKVDLIRLIILMEEITINPNSYAIYADLDSQGVDEGFLFNEESIHLLDAHGLVLPLGQSQYFENSFHILAGENLTCDNSMIIAIQKILIDFNIQKIINGYTLDSQDIFSLYMDLFTYYLIIKGIYTKKHIHYVDDIINSLNESNKIDLLLPKTEPSDPTKKKIIIDKDVLLALNIQEIGRILFSKQVRTKNIGFFKENISIDEYKKFIPVRIDLGNLSPHRSAMAGYEKKYLLL